MNVFSLGDKNFLKSLLFTAFQGNETTFISIDGLIKRDDVENAIGAAAKDLL